MRPRPPSGTAGQTCVTLTPRRFSARSRSEVSPTATSRSLRPMPALAIPSGRWRSTSRTTGRESRSSTSACASEGPCSEKENSGEAAHADLRSVAAAPTGDGVRGSRRARSLPVLGGSHRRRARGARRNRRRRDRPFVGGGEGARGGHGEPVVHSRSDASVVQGPHDARRRRRVLIATEFVRASPGPFPRRQRALLSRGPVRGLYRSLCSECHGLLGEIMKSPLSRRELLTRSTVLLLLVPAARALTGCSAPTAGLRAGPMRATESSRLPHGRPDTRTRFASPRVTTS